MKTSHQQEMRIKEIKTQISQLRANTISNPSKTDYLKNQSHCNNILIDGVPDTKEEAWDQCKQKVQDVKDKLKMDPWKIEIESTHRNGRYQQGIRPHLIVAKLLRFKDKEAILQRVKYLKGSNIYINKNFSETV